MADEKSYESHLLELHEALEKLAEWPDNKEYRITQMAHELWLETVREAADAEGDLETSTTAS